MSTSNLHKLAKEQFVSDLGGSSTEEIIMIMTICIPIYFTTRKIQENILFNFVLHFIIPLLMVTMYNDYKLLLYIFAFAPLFFMSSKPNQKNNKNTSSGNKKKKLNYLTAYRSHMLIMTGIAILAVDFKVFPRKLGKVETWGTSLMDLGVGSFIFSNGIVSRPKPKKEIENETGTNKNKKNSKASCIFSKLILRKSNILFVLGLLRLFFVKNLEYQEHLTEYGKHWNFFITLGLLPLTYDFILVPLIETTHINRGILGFLMCAALELWLNLDSRVLKYLINAERVGIFGNNREGIYSFLGYVGIYLMGQEVGSSLILPVEENKNLRKNFLGRYKVDDLQGLIGHALLIWALNNSILQLDKFYISRRFANLPYVLWVVSYNLGFLAFYCFVDRITNIEDTDFILECINNNGLILFLVANVSTGLVNISINTLSCNTAQSIAILISYCGFIFISALVLNKYQIRI
ncbi:GWT1-domain-containing protein [Hanseniaspora valbyensis NRRL Y-1626]|uniref:GPI-anchored wall transfer protein n=1 Tax=Hanseniaspora valbyensis NRRL Y-1626 TaxID=766949 RepID=A0A1B7TE60_9ASCO|nr:GWT1-domain-containing protein [Hanseniaspora valbyensis NRRL Y-1626]